MSSIPADGRQGGDAAQPRAADVGIGLAAARMPGRYVRDVLYEVPPNDPATLAVVAITLLAVAAVASWIRAACGGG